MARVGRHIKVQAREGRGAELADRLLAAADALRGFPGCELYVIHRGASDPDTVLVTEVWADRAAVDASLREVSDADKHAVLALVAEGGWTMDETLPLGGVGLEPVEDAAR